MSTTQLPKHFPVRHSNGSWEVLLTNATAYTRNEPLQEQWLTFRSGREARLFAAAPRIINKIDTGTEPTLDLADICEQLATLFQQHQMSFGSRHLENLATTTREEVASYLDDE